VRVKGKWAYLYRAVDSRGASIDFLLTGGLAAKKIGAISAGPKRPQMAQLFAFCAHGGVRTT
jgi:hypothetical protein